MLVLNVRRRIDLQSVIRIKQWIFDHKILCLIISFGFLLRVVSILWGIPISPYVRSFHPDEPKVYESVLKFPEIYLTAKPFPGYGTAVQYILGVFLMPLKLIISQILGLRHSYEIWVWIISRLASVFMGTATIYLSYRLGEKLFNKRTAVISAFFVATSFYHVIHSSIITLDAIMGFMLVINFLLCLRAIEENRLSSYVWLGLATGLLVGMKITGGLFFLIPLLLNLIDCFFPIREGDREKISLFQRLKFLFVYFSIAMLVFLIFHPHIILGFSKYVNFYLREKVDWIDRTRSSISQVFNVWMGKTCISVGAPVTFLALLGVFTSGRKNLRHKSMLVVFIILYYVFWRWFLKARYIITVAPLICIFAANVCAVMIEKKKLIKWIGVSCMIVSIGYSLYCCVSGIYLRLHDTRPLAAQYIDREFPEGTTIGFSAVSEKYTWKNHGWRYPKVNLSKFKETNFLEKPDVFIASSYDYERILETLKSGKLSDDYALDPVYYKEWYRYGAPSPKIFKFYDDLFLKEKSDYFLLKIFKIKVNVPIEFSPPEIRIYKKLK